ncbi:hypothetical protein D3C73_1559360 [compost metagenome]
MLADGQLKLDIAFFNDNVRVGNGRQQRDLHGLADDAFVFALFVDDGLVIVELDGNRFAILYADLHEEVRVGFARSDLSLNHGL